MNRKFLGIVALIQLQIAALLFFLPASYADSLIENTLTNSLTIDAKALFKEAAYVTVEHETFEFTANDSFSVLEGGKTLKKQAYVSVKGAEGETVMYSCSVDMLMSLKRLAGGEASIKRRDCNGSDDIHPRQIVSGQRVYNTVSLNNNMLPHEGGPRESHVTIDVMYL